MLERFFGLFHRRALRKEEMVGYTDKLLTASSPVRISESYGMIRTNLLYSGICNDRCPVIGITSGSPNEGKSLNCANLAISFSFLGKRVLVLDGDMRNATQQTVFDLRADCGLSEYLSGQCEMPDILPTPYEGLSVITGGKRPPNAGELLYNGKIAALLDTLKSRFDVIFFDLPPVGIISDAAVIAEHVDGYIIVVQVGHSEKRVLRNVLETQKQLSEKLIGFMLNGVENHAGHGNSYNYYGYYDRYERPVTGASADEEDKK